MNLTTHEQLFSQEMLDRFAAEASLLADQTKANDVVPAMPDWDIPTPRMSQYFSHFGEVMLADDQSEITPEGFGEYLGGEYSLRAHAFPEGDRALLVVSTSEWVESGIVRWPLEFVAPAAVAGACCAPRYGF